MTTEEAYKILDFIIGDIYDQVFYDWNAHEFDETEYDALMFAITVLKEKISLANGVTVQETGKDTKVLTRADRIRAMQTSELAELFTDAVADGCPPNMDWDCMKDEYERGICDACWEKWLQQPAKEGTI